MNRTQKTLTGLLAVQIVLILLLRSPLSGAGGATEARPLLSDFDALATTRIELLGQEDRKLTLSIQPAVPVPHGYTTYWPFAPDARRVIDITLGVVLSEPSDFEILGYVALPRWLTGDNTFRFTGSSSRAELFGRGDLGFLQHLI